LKIWNKTKEGK